LGVYEWISSGNLGRRKLPIGKNHNRHAGMDNNEYERAHGDYRYGVNGEYDF